MNPIIAGAGRRNPDEGVPGQIHIGATEKHPLLSVPRAIGGEHVSAPFQLVPALSINRRESTAIRCPALSAPFQNILPQARGGTPKHRRRGGVQRRTKDQTGARVVLCRGLSPQARLYFSIPSNPLKNHPAGFHILAQSRPLRLDAKHLIPPGGFRHAARFPNRARLPGKGQTFDHFSRGARSRKERFRGCGQVDEKSSDVLDGHPADRS